MHNGILMSVVELMRCFEILPPGKEKCIIDSSLEEETEPLMDKSLCWKSDAVAKSESNLEFDKCRGHNFF